MLKNCKPAKGNAALNSNEHPVLVGNNLGSKQSDILAESNLINSNPTSILQNKTNVYQDKSCTILVNTSSLPNIYSSTNYKRYEKFKREEYIKKSLKKITEKIVQTFVFKHRKPQEEELQQVYEDRTLNLVQKVGGGAVDSSFDNLLIVGGNNFEGK